VQTGQIKLKKWSFRRKGTIYTTGKAASAGFRGRICSFLLKKRSRIADGGGGKYNIMRE
jgi:hypothetical protein